MKKTILSITTKNGMRFIKEEDIIYCKANGSYSTIFLTKDRQYISSKKLKTIEILLKDHHFFRIHHSHFINITHIDSFINGTEQKVIMSNGEELEVSKRKKTAFLNLFKHL